MKTTCENCGHWQDWRNRVYACVAGVNSNMVRNRLELRLCKFNPHPTQDSYVPIYTDKDYYCSQWINKEQS